MNILEKLTLFYDGFSGEKGYIGYTERGKLIPYFKIGNGKPCILAQYAIHAREYITTCLALEQIEYLSNKPLYATVYFVPAVNIDGIEICLKNKPLYKANALGVDLNVNFDAGWGKGEFNSREKADENYIGEYPFCASETKALRDFTLSVNPDLTLSYHAKGEEVYWYFNQGESDKKRDYALAKIIAKSTGYKLKLTPNSYGGYKDWCISELKIPSFTVEVGADNLSHPIGEENLKEIFDKNKEVIPNLLKELKKTDYEKKIYD